MWEYQLIQHIDKSLLLFSCSVTSDSATPWAVAHQAPLSMGFPRQEHQSGLPFPSPGDIPDPGIDPTSPVLQVDSLLLGHQGSSGLLYRSENNTRSLMFLLAFCFYVKTSVINY